jgi:mono/diheme cytochrome c family protein
MPQAGYGLDRDQSRDAQLWQAALIRITREVAMRRTVVVASAAMILSASNSEAQVAAGSARGQHLASRLCATCHVTGRTPADMLNADIPSFRTIAKRTGMNAETIAGKIIVPHPAMPGVALTADEIRDLATYIMTLATEAR